jgi:hypothetical protein
MPRIFDNIEHKLLFTLRATLQVDERVDFDLETLAILAFLNIDMMRPKRISYPLFYPIDPKTRTRYKMQE